MMSQEQTVIDLSQLSFKSANSVNRKLSNTACTRMRGRLRHARRGFCFKGGFLAVGFSR